MSAHPGIAIYQGAVSGYQQEFNTMVNEYEKGGVNDSRRQGRLLGKLINEFIKQKEAYSQPQ